MTDEREADVERRCDQLATAFGYAVRKYSVRKRSPIEPGTPDRRYVGKHAFWYEVKRVGGPPRESRLTADQHAYLVAEVNAGALASCGTTLELAELLNVLVRDPARAPALCRKHIQAWAAKGFRREAA